MNSMSNWICPGPLRRRSFLQMGALGFGGLTLADLERLRAASTRPKRQTSVILVWLPGGAPHMETYDLKPDAPEEYRGIFKPIPTTVAGLDVCEYLPRHAQMAQKYNIIRSVAHEFADHGGGHKRFLTGRKPKEPAGFVNDAPMVGSIVAKERDYIDIGMPNYIAGVDRGRSGVDVFSFGAAYLGSSYTPFIVPGDPADKDFKIDNIGLAKELADRLDDRDRLRAGFDQLRRAIDQSGSMSAMDEFHQKALGILTSNKTREAFDLSREPLAVRERFGMHAWGQRALLARRLVQAGCSFVTMVMENPYQSGFTMPKDGTYNWDSHAVNCHMFNDLKNRLPIYDQAVTALVEDIHQQGLERDVMVIVTGEFGRTPRITNQEGTQTKVKQPGRDHWPQAMSMLLFGGGMRTGQVIGSTNSKGEHPKERPLSPNDLWATVYQHLGIDWEKSYPDHAGRPMPILPFGRPIDELLPA